MSDTRTEIELCRKEYKRQKELEKIVSARVLQRPNTSKAEVVLLLVMVPPLLSVPVLFFFFARLRIVVRSIILFFGIILVHEAYLRFCLIQAVKCYQHYANEETRRRCLCIPSCSDYAILSLKTVFPLIIALFKIRKRLYVTCDGVEYKVDFPSKKMTAAFENEHVKV